MENWNDIRYLIFDEIGTIMTAISFLVGIITFFSFKKKTTRGMALVALTLTIVIGANYIDLKYINPIDDEEKCKVPNITGMSFSNAQIVLRACGLNERIVGYDSNMIAYDESPLVYNQNPSAGTEVEKGSVVILSVEEIGISDNTNSGLSIKIREYSIFTDGYYYEYPDPGNPNANCVIDFKTGVYGVYEYSRNLNAAEQDNWFHGGKLYDANGNEIGEEGNYPAFWSNSDGMFAVEFPTNLPSGCYTYELYQFIDGQYISDRIDIVVN